MNTWTIKNSLGQTVESRFACDTTDPDEALRRYSFTPSVAEKCKEFGQKPLGSATLNLTGRVVMWRDGKTLHLAECIKEEGTTVLVWVGHQDVKRLRRDAVEVFPDSTDWLPTGEYRSFAQWPAGTIGWDSDISTDLHASEASANAVVARLMRRGFGGDGKVFPVRAWVNRVTKPASLFPK